MSSLLTPAAELTPSERAVDVVNSVRKKLPKVLHIDVLDAIAAEIADAEKRGIEAAASTCADRADRHGDAAERLLPSTAAIEFMALRGEAIACEREVRALTEGGH